MATIWSNSKQMNLTSVVYKLHVKDYNHESILSIRVGMLAPFIRYLEDSNLLDFNHILSNSNEGFETRFKIQKYVFLAERFGLDNQYRYTMYRYGPYSSNLADDYYSLGENMELFQTQSEEPLSETFDRENFISLVNDKNTDWLEISSTLIDQNRRFDNDEYLVSHIENIKCNYSTNYIWNVLRDLQANQIL